MPKILIIQSRTDPARIESEQAVFRRSLEGVADVSFSSSVDATLSWDKPEQLLSGFHGFILGGSGDFDFDGGRPENDPVRKGAKEILGRLRPLILYALESGFPVFGVCFGHQLMAEALGADVKNDKAQEKHGTFDITLTQEGHSDKLFSSLPDTFAAQYNHSDSVTALPRGATLLANNGICKYSVLRYGENAYSAQFHPERILADIVRDDRYKGKHIAESPEASRILRLWVEKIIAHLENKRPREREAEIGQSA